MAPELLSQRDYDDGDEVSTAVAERGTLSGKSWFDKVTATICLGTHRRVGKGSPLRALDAPLLARILSAVELVVPDMVDTLAEAISQARPDQRIVLRKGQYECGATEKTTGFVGQRAADTVLHISKSVQIIGEPGAVIKGMLVLQSGTKGRIEGITIVDSGDCCISSVGAAWEIENSHLQCGHAASIDLLSGSSFTLRNCRLGGEEPSRAQVWYHEAYGSVQEFGISKRACYGMRVKGNSTLHATHCELSHCSEAAVFLSDTASVTLDGCVLQENSCCFISGYGLGRQLQAHRSSVSATKQLWFDGDRPTSYEWGVTNNVCLS